MDKEKERIKTIHKIANEMAKGEEIKEILKSITELPETTRNHYGDYMAWLSRFEGGKRTIVALALAKAGGNGRGIADAMRLLDPGGF